MINVKFIPYFFLLLVFACGACHSNSNIVAESAKPNESSPSMRVSAYHRTLSKSDFIGANRFYSKRVLAIKLNDREIKGCKKPEDCLTAANRISGFEVVMAGGQSKVLKEIPTTDANRTSVITVPPFPLSGSLRYELIREDNDWYIDKAFWENGEVIAGFEEKTSSEGRAGGIGDAPMKGGMPGVARR